MFTKILVANRGEIAIRAFRAAYELGAQTVAVFPYEDRDSLHRQKADESYQIGEPGHPVRAYLDVAEIIRAAILSVPRGQWEAAETIGMGYAATLRRIILPQAARTAVPPLSNTLISLVKDTSLASVVLVTELLRVAQIAAAPTFQFFALYGVAALIYWVICLILSFVQGRLETRLERHVAR